MKETNKQKNKTKQNKDQRTRVGKGTVRGKGFCCAFKLGFLQLRCKASLIFKSNLS